MPLQKEPFRKYSLTEDKKTDVFSVKLNKEERAMLDRCKKLIEQPKDSTGLKTLAWIGAKVILGDPAKYILMTAFKNKRNNWRSGIAEIE